MSSSQMHPVEAFHASLTTLEALLSQCLATPEVRAVHKLRTQTRRVEAMLTLLSLMPELPGHGKPSDALSRQLRRIRRAAGRVRDLDVHRNMLEGFADQEHALAEAPPPAAAAKPEPSSPPATRQGGTRKVGREMAEATPSPGVSKLLSQAAAELRHHLGERRDAEAADLRHTLQHLQGKLSKAAGALSEALAAAGESTLPAADLLRNAQAVARRSDLLKDQSPTKLNEKQLHTLRKDAKAGRYLAEALPENPTLVEAAQHLEALQHLGGEWHDALEIAQAARKHFGKGHVLAVTYREQRDLKLAAYRDALLSEQQVQTGSRTGKGRSAGKASKPARDRSARAAANTTPSAQKPTRKLAVA